jgi:hypothetical protein
MGRANFRWGRDNGLICYAFPLGDGRTADLWLPGEGLTADDAQRLKAYIDTLIADSGMQS